MVPETRYKRSKPAETSPAGQNSLSDEAKSAATSQIVEKVEDNNTTELSGTKKTFLENLSLWSGTSEESLVSHFMRPWLLGAYPAVTWATIACEYLPRELT